MSKFRTKVWKQGNSFLMTIPKNYATDFHVGESIMVEAHPDKIVVWACGYQCPECEEDLFSGEEKAKDFLAGKEVKA